LRLQSSIDFLGIHLLQFSHGNERIETSDTICDVFASIAKEASFHVVLEQLHVLPLMLQTSRSIALTLSFRRMGFKAF
jgi:hypothetical protein